MTVRRWSVAGAASFSTTRYRTPHDTPMSDMEIIRISERIVTPGYEETVKEVMEKVGSRCVWCRAVGGRFGCACVAVMLWRVSSDVQSNVLIFQSISVDVRSPYMGD